MIRKSACIVYAICSAVFASASDGVGEIPDGFYRGTIGPRQVSLCINALDTSEYYEEKSGKSIELHEIEGKPDLLLESEPAHPVFSEDFDPGSSEAWWQITENKDGLRGKRQGTKVDPKEGAISLKLVDKSCKPGYEAHRLQMPFVKKSVLHIEGVEIDLLSHPVTAVDSSHVSAGLPPAALEKINAQLLTEQGELNERWPYCDDWEAHIYPRFVSQLWLVFDITTSGYCGGFHPNETSFALAFDSQTGEQIDFDPWIDTQYWALEGTVSGKLRETLTEKLKENAEECVEQQSEFLEWKYFQPWMGADGFFFRLDQEDRAYLYCEMDYGLSFEEMRPFIEKSYLELYDKFVSVARKTADKQPAIPEWE